MLVRYASDMGWMGGSGQILPPLVVHYLLGYNRLWFLFEVPRIDQIDCNHILIMARLVLYIEEYNTKNDTVPLLKYSSLMFIILIKVALFIGRIRPKEGRNNYGSETRYKTQKYL
eukprot:TRINITY_DN28635_c1_g2_i1.p1 TRINITY_DN28635_c1_g2~~TRINITY_DN28635_c1_g2_i1.p1  ORF type:complete len:115 (+),score=4.38 TRINITY_DN28635_c1_g2_i1:846-1190(+)